MEVIKKKLHFIKDNWNTYFYNNSYFNKHLSSREEISTNYFGDIMHYFFDTFEILDTKKYMREDNCSFTECISNSIMLLQTMYVHQDLMDEMLYIFKLKRSNSNDKIQIRQMDLCQYLGHNFFRFLRIFFLKFYRA